MKMKGLYDGIQQLLSLHIVPLIYFLHLNLAHNLFFSFINVYRCLGNICIPVYRFGQYLLIQYTLL